MTPSVRLAFVLQTRTQTWPGPLTRIFMVGRLPVGTVEPAFGASGVMPFLVAADAAVGTARSPAMTSRSVRRGDMRPP